MSRNPSRFTIVLGFAGVAGLLEGANPTSIAAIVRESTGRSLDHLGLLVSGLSTLSLAVTIGVFLASYWWAGHANVPRAYGHFAVSLFVAAVLGYAIGSMVVSVLHLEFSLAAIVDHAIRGSLSVVMIPVIGLAGGAIAQYRSVL